MLAPSQTGCMTPATPILSLKLTFSICKMGPPHPPSSLSGSEGKEPICNAGEHSLSTTFLLVCKDE